jgi:hypothetical protein
LEHLDVAGYTYKEDKVNHKNSRGQGTAEYLVIVGIVVAMVLTVVMTPLGTAIKAKIADLAAQMLQKPAGG